MQLAAVLGCAPSSYQYGRVPARTNQQPSQQVAITYGQPHKTLDGISDTLSWPERKLTPELPDRRKITPQTTAQVVRYLEQNELTDVQLSVRDYQPREQWKRLHENDSVSPLARYSVGSLTILGYSLFPGTVFNYNSYNPYTNTLNLNSDRAVVAIHQAALAKKTREHSFPAFYAITSHVPVVSTWHKVEGVNDVVGYAQSENDWQLEQESYQQLYPMVGSQAVGGAAMFAAVWWGGPLISLAGSATGSVVGRTTLSKRERERSHEFEQLVESEVTGRAKRPEVQQASFESSAGLPNPEPHANAVYPETTAQGRRVANPRRAAALPQRSDRRPTTNRQQLNPDQ